MEKAHLAFKQSTQGQEKVTMRTNGMENLVVKTKRKAPFSFCFQNGGE